MQVHDRPAVETLQATGTQILDTLKNLLHEGNVRKISIKQRGNVIAEFPLTFGVIGVAVAPALAAIGAITALATDCTIEIERTTSAAPNTSNTSTTSEPAADAPHDTFGAE